MQAPKEMTREDAIQVVFGAVAFGVEAVSFGVPEIEHRLMVTVLYALTHLGVDIGELSAAIRTAPFVKQDTDLEAKLLDFEELLKLKDELKDFGSGW